MRIRRIVFCIFSGQHRNFCSLRRSVATGNYQMLEEVLGGNPPKNGTSHWTSLLGMFFCTFSGQCEPFRLFKRPIQTMIMIGKNRFRAKNLPKNGTSHWSHIRRILFRIFSAPYRLFRSSCTGLIAGSYDMLEEVPR